MARNSFTSNSSLRRVSFLLAFIAGLVAIDRTTAYCLTKLLHGITTGQASGGLINAALQKADSSVLVFGSSLACHHIDPVTIEKLTGRSCFNAGCDGQNIDYARMLEALLLKKERGHNHLSTCSIGAIYFSAIRQPPTYLALSEGRVK